MIKKIFLMLSVVLFMVSISVEAQTVLKGTILKADGKPADEVVVSLEVDGVEQSLSDGIASGTIVSADLNGNFSISILKGQEIFVKFTAIRLIDNNISQSHPTVVVDYTTRVQYVGQKVMNVMLEADGKTTLKGKISPHSNEGYGYIEIVRLDGTFGRSRQVNLDGTYEIEGLPLVPH